MSRSLWLAVLAVGACAPGAQQPFDEPAQAAVRDAAIATLRGYEAAAKSLDSARIVAFYADDPAFRFVEGQHAIQRSEMLTVVGSLRRSLRTLEGGFTYDSLTVIPLAPTLAIAAAPYIDIMTDTAGVTTTVRGFVTWHLRQGTGGWQFLYGHAAPLPPETKDK